MDVPDEFDDAYLRDFSRLPAEVQREIIRLTRAPARDPRVAKRDREAAESRAKRLEAARKKS